METQAAVTMHQSVSWSIFPSHRNDVYASWQATTAPDQWHSKWCTIHTYPCPVIVTETNT